VSAYNNIGVPGTDGVMLVALAVLQGFGAGLDVLLDPVAFRVLRGESYLGGDRGKIGDGDGL
jgi:hypothetical protein